MEIVLRVKRLSTDLPIDFIQLQKKPKKFEDFFSNLNLGQKITLKRATEKTDLLSADQFKPFPTFSETRRKEARNLLIKKFRNQVITQDDLIFYNGVPLKTEIPETIKDSVIDEYYLCEIDENDANALHALDIDFGQSSDEEFDSDDSNCEDNYKNDYPDEESSSDSESYDKSIDSEEYDYEAY
jgi:hypothetical protein